MNKGRYQNWRKLPGGFDALNTKHIYSSDNEWGIPNVPAAPLASIPVWLSSYRGKPEVTKERNLHNGAIHFFLDDYQFESLWQRPIQTLKGIKKWKAALSPDFSLFYDCPRAIQLWNIYRSRWMNCWWNTNGIVVIPTVSWSSSSYDFCFYGLPKRSVLAVSTVGIFKEETAKYTFLEGFEKMINFLTPTAILCYGKIVEGMEQFGTIPLYKYPSHWEKNQHRAKNQPQDIDLSHVDTKDMF